MHKMAFAAGFAFAVGMGTAGTAQAGFLDFLFSRRVDTPRVEQPVHPELTISQPRQKPRKVTRRVIRAPELSPKEQLARTIDPYKNPRWYLEDPTLRKGDILVLSDRVLVFTGGALGAPKSYVALNSTRLLTREERQRVAAMTGPKATAPAMLASAGPRQPRVLKSVAVMPPVLGSAAGRGS